MPGVGNSVLACATPVRQAVPAMGIVAETMVALVLAQEAQRNFGGDSVEDFVRNAESFAKRIS